MRLAARVAALVLGVAGGLWSLALAFAYLYVVLFGGLGIRAAVAAVARPRFAAARLLLSGVVLLLLGPGGLGPYLLVLAALLAGGGGPEEERPRRVR